LLQVCHSPQGYDSNLSAIDLRLAFLDDMIQHQRAENDGGKQAPSRSKVTDAFLNPSSASWFKNERSVFLSLLNVALVKNASAKRELPFTPNCGDLVTNVIRIFKAWAKYGLAGRLVATPGSTNPGTGRSVAAADADSPPSYALEIFVLFVLELQLQRFRKQGVPITDECSGRDAGSLYCS
jgi:hypothetical protein